MNTTETEKKKSKSFWNRLLHFPRSKSQVRTSKDEDSFRRQSMSRSSLHLSHKGAASDSSSSTSGESENFTTMESSALMDLHKDSGILIINKESLENCFMPREEDKHVQFVPTPMNKYYDVQRKSTFQPKKQREENKENGFEVLSGARPARPILKSDKNKKLFDFSAVDVTDVQRNSDRYCLNTTDSPDLNPSMTRTSTKVALVDRKNLTLSQLNVSNIGKYNSLPRNQKVLQRAQEPCRTNITETLLSAHHSSDAFKQQDLARRHNGNQNLYRQSCYGISNPSRMFEDDRILNSYCIGSNQDVNQRYSLGGPLEAFPHKAFDSNCSNNGNKQALLRRSLRYPQPLKENMSREVNQNQDLLLSRTAFQPGHVINHLSKQPNYASTGQIPNQAINKIGLPYDSSRKTREPPKGRSSESPHYVRLSETFSISDISSNNRRNPQSAFQKVDHVTEPNSKSYQQKPKPDVCSCKSQSYKDGTCKLTAPCAEQVDRKSALVSEARKKEILLAMNSQKKRIFRKVCKYKREFCEDGFSSMADDECSFNCSCRDCFLKQSRAYKRNGFKNFFSNKNKYFFTIEPDIKEGNEIDRLPENQTVVGNMAQAQPHLSNKGGLEHDKAWYDCNDSLCCMSNQLEPKATNKKEIAKHCKTPSKQFVENIYENITNIINSATKRNLRPQDVKKIFSTPLASPLNLRGSIKSARKSPRALFQDDETKSLDRSFKNIFTPNKTSECFNDSIMLLQEIFLKLSQECQELLQPNISSCTSGYQTSDTQSTPTSKYVNDLVKNLKSNEISEADFALIIGGIAQNIFSETKSKQSTPMLKHSTSLPELNKSLLDECTNSTNSIEDLCISDGKGRDQAKVHSVSSEKSSRQLPEGWSRTPTTEYSSIATDISSTLRACNSSESKNSSKCSEGDMELLENAIRIGMGLKPFDKAKKTFTPSKATKYKSKDVLSGKGKLKLKIYNNCGFVTVFVMKAAKLSWATNRELNSYVKITMVPDDTKRVHWRTNVQKAKLDPVYNQKFSFDVFPEDEARRLVFSLWHRDYANQRSELIGCMSFSIKSIMENKHNLDGWYRLLREKFGTAKHFAAHSYKSCCPNQHAIK